MKVTRVDLKERFALDRAVLEGHKLSPEAAKRLERRLHLSVHPSPVAGQAMLDRARLFGFYDSARWPREDENAAERYAHHGLWFVAHRPKAAAGLLTLRSRLRRATVQSAKDLWREHLSRAPRDADLIERAAEYLEDLDWRMSERLFKRGERLEPKSPSWPRSLGQFYLRRARGKKARSRTRMATLALRCHERAHGMERDASAGRWWLNDMANAAVLTGQWAEAARYAREALRAAAHLTVPFRSERAKHQAHTLLGLVALHRGNAGGAKRELLASGLVGPSSELAFYGPEFDLAAQLLEQGEWFTVCRYLELIKRWWEPGGLSIDSWLRDVKAHRVPDFHNPFPAFLR